MPTTFDHASRTIFQHRRLWDGHSVFSFLVNWRRAGAVLASAHFSLAMYCVERDVFCGIATTLTFLLLLLDFFRAFSISGEWKITVTDEHVSWATPKSRHYPVDDILGKSFRCRISDVEYICVTRAFYPSRKARVGNEYMNCLICVKHDRKYHLTAVGSGIDLGSFLIAMRTIGVPYRESLLNMEDIV